MAAPYRSDSCFTASPTRVRFQVGVLTSRQDSTRERRSSSASSRAGIIDRYCTERTPPAEVLRATPCASRPFQISRSPAFNSGRTMGNSSRSTAGRIGSRSVGCPSLHSSNRRNSSGSHWNPPWSGRVSFSAMIPCTRCGSTPSVVSTSQCSSMSKPVSVGAISARSRFLTLGGFRLSRSSVTHSSSQSHTSTNAS